MTRQRSNRLAGKYGCYKALELKKESYVQHMFSENIHITYVVGVRFQILKL